MTSTSSSLENRVQALEDIAAIKDVQYAYWRAIDLKLPDAFRQVFASGDISIDFPGTPVMRDREVFIQFVTENGMSPSWQGNHFGVSPQIRLTSADTASGHWRVQMIGYDFNGRTIMRMTGEYESEYVRAGDEWRIKTMAVRQHSFFVESVAQGGELKAGTFGPL